MGNPDDKHEYFCRKTNYDWSMRYALLDAWRHRPDFETLLRDSILNQQALDRIMIGFNGTSVAANTNRVANPLLQDVNKGWLQNLREEAPARVMTQGNTAGVVKVGAAGDYKNLDALVFDAVNELIKPWFQDDTDLVVVCGRKLLADKYFPIIDKDNAPVWTPARLEDVTDADVARYFAPLGADELTFGA